jgi:hypothetical protein
MPPAGVAAFSVLPFSRATHLELWISLAGGLPQLVMKVPIGTTSVVESTAAAEMGESFIGAFERFPRCSMNVIWNDRQLMAGDPDNPDTVYMSELFLPERWAGLSFRTRDGAPVTGMLALRDYCLVFARDKTYMLQGYTENDFTFQMIEQSLGSVGHQCNSVVHGSGYVWTEKGPYMFNGSWHPLSPENSFRIVSVSQDFGATSMRSVADPDSNTYMVLHNEPQGLVVDRYISHYDYALGSNGALVFDYTTVQPETGGTFAGARMSIDTPSDPTYNCYYLANKWGYGRMYSLNNQSVDSLETIYSVGNQSFFVHPHLRLQDMTTYPWQNIPGTWIVEPPTFTVVCGHYYFQDPGWTFMEGKTFQRLWFDLRSYTTDSTLELCPGDDDALEFYFGRLAFDSGWGPGDSSLVYTVPVHEGTQGGVGAVLTLSPDGMTGRGLSFVFRATKLGYGASFRGFGGAILEGPASRYGLRVPGE